jgi:hypothetical protein
VKRSPPPKRKARLRSRSTRRDLEAARRAVVVERVQRRDRSCRATSVMEVSCGGPLDPHEVIPRSAWRGGYLVETNVILVCRNHHRWIDNHPEDAHALGLHGYSWEVDR